jgi:crotonobetainyl-CoA:carnitine CoA-transferase CaiB-like acyl-CoA transferase
MALLGEAGSAPSICRAGQGDHTTALNLLAATMTALRMRDLTGEGQVADVTLLGTGMWTISSDISRVLVATDTQPPRVDRALPPNPLVNSYRCRDGLWILLSMPQSDPYWPRFCNVIERPEWINDPRFDTLANRGRNSKELAQFLDSVFAAATRDEWASRLDAQGLLWSPIAELPELVADETVRALGSFERVEHPDFGPYETLSAPFKIKDADIQVRGPAPTAGADTWTVLEEFGFTEDEVSELAVAGVFG